MSAIVKRAGTTVKENAVKDRQDARMTLFKSLRILPLMHNWSFWYDKYIPSVESNGYNNNLIEIAQFNTVPDFWRIWNNLPIEVSSRDAIHMFKKGVQPRWEDPRNKHGGAWTFRVQRDKASEFFGHVLLLLIGESLSSALDSHDDICGASLSAKYSSNLITLWNRIAPDMLPTSAITPRSTSLPFGSTVPEEGSSPVENGVEKMKDEILRSLPLELMPQGWYYRVHSRHRDFKSEGTGKLEE